MTYVAIWRTLPDMEDEVNDQLIERAHALAEELASHPSGADRQILKAIKENDLEHLRHLVTKFEGELAAQSFYNDDVYGVF